MPKITKLDSVTKYNHLRGFKSLHPLVTMLDLSKAVPMPAQTFHFGLYAIYLKELECGELSYERSKYDYQEGTLVFIAPGQVLGIQPKVKTFQPKGWALLFDPELIRGTSLGRMIKEYNFFSYDVNEALHISENERKIIVDCFNKIQFELERGIDKHSRTLISSNIELFLNYCQRFYDRQFITRENTNKGVLEKFENLLITYFNADLQLKDGIPTVSYCAKELNISSNYFGDLVKKESGISALEYIRTSVINLAKDKILESDKSVSDVAYELGFKYPQHFTRLFKLKVGVPPTQYKTLVNN
jgi:AraC family transcriptional activator of pobA